MGISIQRVEVYDSALSLSVGLQDSEQLQTRYAGSTGGSLRHTFDQDAVLLLPSFQIIKQTETLLAEDLFH